MCLVFRFTQRRPLCAACSRVSQLIGFVRLGHFASFCSSQFSRFFSLQSTRFAQIRKMTVEVGEEEWSVIQEGMAKISFKGEKAFFYNEIQEFNRDLTWVHVQLTISHLSPTKLLVARSRRKPDFENRVADKPWSNLCVLFGRYQSAKYYPLEWQFFVNSWTIEWRSVRRRLRTRRPRPIDRPNQWPRNRSSKSKRRYWIIAFLALLSSLSVSVYDIM